MNLENTKPLQNEMEKSEPKYLLSDESFALLIHAQKEIEEKTELRPSLRKLVNSLINSESVRQLKKHWITELKVLSEEPRRAKIGS